MMIFQMESTPGVVPFEGQVIGKSRSLHRLDSLFSDLHLDVDA